MNPLLSRSFRIPFDEIRPEHVVPGINEAIESARQRIADIARETAARTFENTVSAIDEVAESVRRPVVMVSHLANVADSPELRQAHTEVVPLYSGFFAEMTSDLGLWRALSEYSATAEAQALDSVRARRLRKLLRTFRRSGVDLPEERRARVLEIRKEMARLKTRFGNNVLDATNAFELIITDESDLAGLPESARQAARAAARAKNLDGWRFTLHLPSYQPFLDYSERRELRRRMFDAMQNRATSGDQDNKPLIREILALRQELARLLGYRDYADFATEEYMVANGTRARTFEDEMYAKTLPYFQAEMRQLEEFARAELGIDRLEPWDLRFAMEKLRQARFDFDSEELRPYFPLPRVVEGLFELTRRLFGVTVRQVDNDAVWHDDVRYYEVRDEDDRHLGSFYADFYPRESKRGGAWMAGLITGRPGEKGLDPHLGQIAMNFTPPVDDRPALLTHREVQTLFHEFGHLLHHVLTTVPVPALAGTNVPSDWVEVPSQFLENWTWQREGLDLYARHFETDEPIPEELYRKMIASRTFMAGQLQMRQLTFGTIDLALHTDYDPASGEDPVEFGNRIRERFVLYPEHARDNFLCGFSHIFAGGYAAGYYSYMWSEMLEADLFTAFEEHGIFHRETGRRFRELILASGDSRDQFEVFREFMNRDPDAEALLRRNLGLGSNQPVA